jgi:hypothetical protein
VSKRNWTAIPFAALDDELRGMMSQMEELVAQLDTHEQKQLREIRKVDR